MEGDSPVSCAIARHPVVANLTLQEASLKTSAAKGRPIPRGITRTARLITRPTSYNDDYFSFR